MEFQVLSRSDWVPHSGRNTVYLKIDHWDDFGFETMFYMSLHDEQGVLHDIGSVKIGFKGQTTEKNTRATLPVRFKALEAAYFSLGQDVDYYNRLASLAEQTRNVILEALKDIVFCPEIFQAIQNENVFGTSFLRDISLSVIKGQFARVLAGQAKLTDFKFKFIRPEQSRMSGIELIFQVKASSSPSTNIHIIIGRNGVGKTTLLNGMIEAITSKNESYTKFLDIEGWREKTINNDYFSSLVSVSFSAFDTFTPPPEQPDPTQGTCYFYVGLKKQKEEALKTRSDIHKEFIEALKTCLSQPSRCERWLKAINALESDENFAGMQLTTLTNYSGNELRDNALKLIERMSSGHAVVLLATTRLVATVEEKTLVLIDEPESHLHPPLLSAFVRALADLLHDRNGVAIVATHSPVVLQEVPKSCVWKINRVGSCVEARRPEIETFGENVGMLTREVFGLEVTKSGFHALLVKSVQGGGSYEDILNDYNDQLGFEARAILRAMVTNRDRNINHDAP